MSFYVQDGLHFEGIKHRMEACHSLWYCSESAPANLDEKWLLQNTDLVFGCKCKAHNCGNAVKWAIGRFASENVMKDCHNSIRSLCDSAFMLRETIPPFLIKHVAYSAPAEDRQWQRREKFWQALGVDVEAMDFLD